MYLWENGADGDKGLVLVLSPSNEVLAWHEIPVTFCEFVGVETELQRRRLCIVVRSATHRHEWTVSIENGRVKPCGVVAVPDNRKSEELKRVLDELLKGLDNPPAANEGDEDGK